MEKNGAETVIECPDDALSFPVLGGGVETGEAQGDAMSRKVGAKCVVIKFTAIVSLKRNEGELELGTDIRMKCK